MDEQRTGRKILLDYRALEGICIMALVAASLHICCWADSELTEAEIGLGAQASQIFRGGSFHCN